MITCPFCGRTSAHPTDAAERYCGACHVFHDDEKARIVHVINRRYSTTVPVDVVDMAVAFGFTTWRQLAAEADSPQR